MSTQWTWKLEKKKERKELKMPDSENSLEDKSREIAEALSCIDFRRLKKLAESDGDFKAVLKLAETCKKAIAASKRKKKKTSWLDVAKALVGKIMSHDPLHINFEDKRRSKDGTWCMWLTWDAMTEIGTMSGYSLVSEHANSRMHEDAAKSFVENFCHVGPDCLKIYNSPYTRERQRLANAAIVAVYKELDCPKTAEEIKSKIFANQ